MWKLLGELAAMYCGAASWAVAAGQKARSSELVERAWAYLVERSWHAPDEPFPRDLMK